MIAFRFHSHCAVAAACAERSSRSPARWRPGCFRVCPARSIRPPVPRLPVRLPVVLLLPTAARVEPDDRGAGARDPLLPPSLPGIHPVLGG
eukprot:7389611-Prymnesium_polylepis.2